MTKISKVAIAFIGIAALGTTAASADWRQHKSRDGMRGNMLMENFDSADADSSGDVTLEEFEAAVAGRLGSVDTNGDKKLTVAEVAAEIERMRNERMARRIISRFDTNDDGELALDEVESRMRKMFALMDRDDDGTVAADEMNRRHHREFGREMHHRRGERDSDNDN